jgi:hypothetical protein
MEQYEHPKEFLGFKVESWIIAAFWFGVGCMVGVAYAVFHSGCTL